MVLLLGYSWEAIVKGLLFGGVIDFLALWGGAVQAMVKLVAKCIVAGEFELWPCDEPLELPATGCGAVTWPCALQGGWRKSPSQASSSGQSRQRQQWGSVSLWNSLPQGVGKDWTCL